MRTFVIGNDNCVLGFALMGVDGRVVHNAEQLDEALSECLSDETLGLVLVSSDVAVFSRERIDTLKVKSLSPLIVEIPGQQEQSTSPSLKEFVQRTVGISLGGQS